MPIYSYKAQKQGKEIVSGEVTASNLKDAKDVIRKMGLVPIQLQEFVDTKAKKARSHRLRRGDHELFGEVLALSRLEAGGVRNEKKRRRSVRRAVRRR